MYIYAPLKCSLGYRLKRSARHMAIEITCCAREHHVSIESDGACCEQQGKAKSFIGRIHFLAPS